MPVRIAVLTRSRTLYGILTLAIHAKSSNLEAGYNIGEPRKIIVVTNGTISAKSLIKQPNAFNSDIRKANYQEKQAYGTYMQTLSKYTKPVQQPSVFATGLTIAGAGLSYGRDPNSLINIKPKDVDKVGTIEGSKVG